MPVESIGCRFSSRAAPDCRNVTVQRAIRFARGSVTTRLSDRPTKRLKEITLRSLRLNTTDTVKGLFVLSEVGPFPCQAQPLIVFGRPYIGGEKADFQHMDLARALGLTQRRKLSEEERPAYDGVRYGEKVFSPGVWRFLLTPVCFSANPGQQNTIVTFDQSGSRSVKIVVNAQAERGLVHPQTGVVNLDRVKNIERPTAEQLWEENIYAYLFRAMRKSDQEVWAVRLLMENNEKDLLPEFLRALARHVAPEFMVYQFVSIGGVYQRSRLPVSWMEAVYPTCLRWPRKMRLIKDEKPVPRYWSKWWIENL